jgi:hypothetical protein
MMGPNGTKLDKVVFPAEFQSVLGLLEIIQNKDAIKKVTDDLKKHADKANALIEKVGKAQEIERLHATALEEQKQSGLVIQQATDTALKLVSDAEEKAGYLTSQAKEAAQEVLSHAEGASKQAIQREKDSKALQGDLKTLQAQLDAANQAQQKRQTDLDKRETDIQRKESILAQLKA